MIIATGPTDLGHPAPTFTSIYETTDVAAARVLQPIDALELSGIVEIEDGRRFRVQHGNLPISNRSHDVWRIGTNQGDAWLATVDSKTWSRFHDIGKVRVGVKTCADKIFIRGDWNDFPEAERPELLRLLTTHHIARRFKADRAKQTRKILYPHELVNGRRQPVNLGLYKKSSAYLQKHRGELQARTYVIEGGRQWYEIWVPQDPGAWNSPKLVFRDITEQPTFWLDLDSTIVNGDCYWLCPENPDKEELLWLAAAIANSTFIERFYDHKFNNKLYAGRRRFMTQYVELFPLPNPKTDLSQVIILGAKAAFEAAGRPEARAVAFGLEIEEAPRQRNL